MDYRTKTEFSEFQKSSTKISKLKQIIVYV